eukprot:3837903-Rhodomonas_salina.2
MSLESCTEPAPSPHTPFSVTTTNPAPNVKHRDNAMRPPSEERARQTYCYVNAKRESSTWGVSSALAAGSITMLTVSSLAWLAPAERKRWLPGAAHARGTLAARATFQPWERAEKRRAGRMAAARTTEGSARCIVLSWAGCEVAPRCEVDNSPRWQSGA